MARSKNTYRRIFHDGKLSPQEEMVLRLKKGLGAKDDEVLERKTEKPELLARLLELESAIIKKAQSRINQI